MARMMSHVEKLSSRQATKEMNRIKKHLEKLTVSEATNEMNKIREQLKNLHKRQEKLFVVKENLYCFDCRRYYPKKSCRRLSRNSLKTISTTHETIEMLRKAALTKSLASVDVEDILNRLSASCAFSACPKGHDLLIDKGYTGGD